MFKVFSSLPIKTLSGVFIVDFKKTSHCSGVSIVEFEQVNANGVSKFFFTLIYNISKGLLETFLTLQKVAENLNLIFLFRLGQMRIMENLTI